MWRFMAASAVFAAVSGTASAQCEVSSTVRALLNQSPFRHRIVESTEEQATQQAAFAKALAEHPDDYFVLGLKCQPWAVQMNA
jgi:hypothetical protein